MARWFLALLIPLAAVASARGQAAPIDPPVAGRPVDFSNIVGKYSIAVLAEPVEVHVNDPITLTVRISGEGPPRYEPKRGLLHILPDWKDDFFVENVPDEDRILRAEKTWVFVYRLRPKHANVTQIDGIKLVTYDPQSRGKNKFIPDDAPAIAIRVTPRPDASAEVTAPTALPDSLYDGPHGAGIAAEATALVSVSAWTIAGVLLVPPLLCGGAVLFLRTLIPDRLTSQARHRSQAAHRAEASLRSGDAVGTIVCRYLEERLEFDVVDPTPTDVKLFLTRRGFAKQRCTQAETFFQACDAERFARTGPRHDLPLSEAAVQLIHALEADPCIGR